MGRYEAAREKAYAKLLEAKALEDEDGTVAAENIDRQTAIMAEFEELDKVAGKIQESEGLQSKARDRLDFYQAKATGSPMHYESTPIDSASAKTPGQQFIDSEAYKKLVASGALTSDTSSFRSDPVTVGRGGQRRMGATATDVIQSETGGPAAGLVTPYYLPGVLELPQRPRVIRDLFPVENMPSGDTISYAAQTGFDSAAAAVAQAADADTDTAAGGLKPQSSVAWTRQTANAEWIATWMAATRQAVADVGQMASLIDNQGRIMIALEEEDQLVNGDGTAPNISGILDQGSIQTLDLTGYGDNANLDGIRTARRLVRTGTSRLRPTFVLVHPEDSEEFDLMKDLEGRYRAGDPFAGAIGGDDSPPIWRLARIESEAVSAGTAIVGARAGATIFEREPLRVLTADQHADFFVRNLVVILFEERLAFPVYFPTAFVEVTFDPWTAGS